MKFLFTLFVPADLNLITESSYIRLVLAHNKVSAGCVNTIGTIGHLLPSLIFTRTDLQR